VVVSLLVLVHVMLFFLVFCIERVLLCELVLLELIVLEVALVVVFILEPVIRELLILELIILDVFILDLVFLELVLLDILRLERILVELVLFKLVLYEPGLPQATFLASAIPALRAAEVCVVAGGGSEVRRPERHAQVWVSLQVAAPVARESRPFICRTLTSHRRGRGRHRRLWRCHTSHHRHDRGGG